MVTVTSYTLQNLTSGTEVHNDLRGYFLTPESVEPLQDLLDNVTATDTCLIPNWDWTCWVDHTEDEAKSRMVQLLKQMDSTLNPHILLAPHSTVRALHVLDPRVRDIVLNFLPKLSQGECYSYSEIEASAAQFAYIAQTSGLALFAETSPCHTHDPRATTCTWSNLPGSVDEGVWLDAGETIHPRLTNVYFTKRAAETLRGVLKKADLKAKTLLADLVLTIDHTLNPYRVQGRKVVIDGSVRTLEHLITQNPSPVPNRLTDAYAWAITEKFNRTLSGYFSAGSENHYQLRCEAEPLKDTPYIGTTARITCSYTTIAADVD